MKAADELEAKELDALLTGITPKYTLCDYESYLNLLKLPKEKIISGPNLVTYFLRIKLQFISS